MSIQITFQSSAPQTEIDAWLADLRETFPALRADVLDLSSPQGPQVGVSEPDATRIAGELRASLERAAPGSEVLVQTLEQGCGLRVVVPPNSYEPALGPLLEIALHQGAPVTLVKRGGDSA